MRTTALARAARAGFALICLAAAAAPAAAVQISAGTGSGIAGQVVDVPVNASNLTGLGVFSYQFALNYDANLLSVDSVVTTGTLTAPWGPATFNRAAGRISVSCAGTSALSGAGPLVSVRFHVNPAATGGGGTNLTFQSFLFNEGSPGDTLTGGVFSVGPTPTITVSPNVGELVRGTTLQFSVFGSVTSPVTWSTTDPAVATVSGTGLLTGVAPGSVRVFAVDNAGLRDTTNGNVVVDGVGVTVGSVAVLQGQPVSVPVTVTSLNGLGVRAGQLTVSFPQGYLTPTGVTTTGTLLAGYGSSNFSFSPGQLTFGFAGTTDLTGSGTLCYLNFTATTATYGAVGVSPATALFNETLPALRTGGVVTINPLPTLTLSPASVTLLAGQQQQFTVGGTPALPLTWSTLDPSVATINSSGLLTAVAGGVTQVKVVDNVGATATNTAVTVYDCKISLPASIDAAVGSTVRVPVDVDRDVSGLGIYSGQFTVLYNAAVVTSASAPNTGLVSAWGPPVYNSAPGDRILVSAAGTQALGHGGPVLAAVDLHISPSATVGSFVPLTLQGFMFNEGRPSVLVVNGQLHITATTVGVQPAGGPLALSAARPNPLRGATRVHFTIPADVGTNSRGRLAVYGLDGRLVRTLLDGPLEAGDHVAAWDARDDRGLPVPAGGYVCRLDWAGRHLERKLVVVH